MTDEAVVQKLVALYRDNRISLQLLGVAVGDPKLGRFVIHHEEFWQSIEPTSVLRLILHSAMKGDKERFWPDPKRPKPGQIGWSTATDAPPMGEG